MKFTNKDAKVRMYDGSKTTGSTFTVVSVTGQTTFTIDATVAENAWAGEYVHFTSGNFSGQSLRVEANTEGVVGVTPATITVFGIINVINPLVAGDTFDLGEPFYFELCLDNGDFSAPIGIKKHEEVLVLDRGNVTACSHYINDNDAGIMEPLSLSFSVMINDSAKFLAWLDWIEGNTVNGHTILTTKGHSERINAGGNLSFADPTKKTCDIEYKMTGTTNDITYIFREVYFNLSEQTYTEAEDGINISMTGSFYGTIMRTTDFSSGVDVLA